MVKIEQSSKNYMLTDTQAMLSFHQMAETLLSNLYNRMFVGIPRVVGSCEIQYVDSNRRNPDLKDVVIYKGANTQWIWGVPYSELRVRSRVNLVAAPEEVLLGKFASVFSGQPFPDGIWRLAIRPYRPDEQLTEAERPIIQAMLDHNMVDTIRNPDFCRQYLGWR